MGRSTDMGQGESSGRIGGAMRGGDSGGGKMTEDEEVSVGRCEGEGRGGRQGAPSKPSEVAYIFLNMSATIAFILHNEKKSQGERG